MTTREKKKLPRNVIQSLGLVPPGSIYVDNWVDGSEIIVSVLSLKEYAAKLKKTVQCNCDLDNWEPEPITGHSWVCRIHKMAMEKAKEMR